MKNLQFHNFIWALINLIIFFWGSIVIGAVFNSITIASTLAILTTAIIFVLFLFIKHIINSKFNLY